jgi:hypothetical protein
MVAHICSLPFTLVLHLKISVHLKKLVHSFELWKVNSRSHFQKAIHIYGGHNTITVFQKPAIIIPYRDLEESITRQKKPIPFRHISVSQVFSDRKFTLLRLRSYSSICIHLESIKRVKLKYK